jgi:formylglycine-generating enzyme required for sulfatase activity
LEQALDCILQAARGLAYAHERGVVHRDIKPANLLLDQQGAIKILDMGLARLETAGEQQDQLTGTGQIMGTVDFMAPEQAMSTKHADARADIYSLGVTLWYLLTGRRLFEGETVVEKLMAHQTQRIPSLQAACPQATLAIEAVFARMVAKTPEARYQSMSELIVDLERCRSDIQQHAEVAAAAGDVAAMAVAKVGPSPRTSLVTGRDPAFPETQISKAPPISSPSTEHDETLKSSAPLVETDPNTERSLPCAPIAVATLMTGGRRWWQDRRVQIALGSGALLLLFLGLWIIVRDKDGREVARIEVPEGGSATVETTHSNEKTNTSPQLPAGPPPLAIAPFDAAKAKEHQEAWAKYLGVPVEMTNSIGMKFVLIPPGEFDMGSSPEEVDWALDECKKAKLPDWCFDGVRTESPRHRVKITKPFYLGMYPVTQGEYLKVIGKNPSDFTAQQIDGSAFTPPIHHWDPEEDREDWLRKRAEHAKMLAGHDTTRNPVDTVSWDECIEFCRKLSALPAEDAAGRAYRLPTEGEWEYACRAGTTTRWFFGDDVARLFAYAWYAENWGGLTHAVGQRELNRWGLGDMLGNVWQWCSDREVWEYYKQSPREDPEANEVLPGEGTAQRRSRRMSRGGCWGIAAQCRPAYRCSFEPDAHSCQLGFRVAVGIAAKKPPVAKSQTPPPSPIPAQTAPASTVPSLAVAPFDAAKAKEHQEAWAQYLGVKVDMENSIGVRFVLIPPGEFDMGSTEEEVAKLVEDAKTMDAPWYTGTLPAGAPKHRVRITKPFWLGVHEVTRGQFRQFVEDRSYKTEGERDGKGGLGLVDGRWIQDPRFIWSGNLGFDQTDDYPVLNVTWNDATAFCAWLSEKEGEQYHLPSEAQWEFACRAGTTTTWYSTDDEASLKEYAWFGLNVDDKTHPVGQKWPNAWGQYDMHGNVWEWCRDWWSDRYYATSPMGDPPGASSGSLRVIRGGGWNYPAAVCRAAYRDRYEPSRRSQLLGFRLARVVSSASASR